MVWTLLFALFFHIPYLNAQQLQAKLTGANDPSLATVKGFGNAVDIYGDTAVVGCDTCDVGTKSCGTVFVYTYTNGIWQADQLLAPSNLVDSIYFGRKVKINQDYILVSAPDIAQTSTTSRPGSAYLFERSWDNVWYEAVNFKLDFDSSNKDKGLPYGSSIALCNDYAFVGCEDCDVTVDNGFNFQLDTGLVDVYRRVNGKWQLFQRLRPALQQITGTTPRFGSDIDTDCDGTGTKRAVIGADTDRLDANIIGAGSALIYVLDDATGLWNFEQKIWYLGTQPNQANLFVNDYFGHAVAIDGDFVTVGAFADNQDANEGYIAQDVGSIYFWERDTTSGRTWSERKIVLETKQCNGELTLEKLPCEFGVDCADMRKFDLLEDTGVGVVSRNLNKGIEDIKRKTRGVVEGTTALAKEFRNRHSQTQSLLHRDKSTLGRVEGFTVGSAYDAASKPIKMEVHNKSTMHSEYSDNWGDVFSVARLLQLAGADLDNDYNMDGWTTRQAGTVLEVRAVYNNLYPILSTFGYKPVQYHYEVSELMLPYVSRMQLAAVQPADYPQNRVYEVRYGILIHFKVAGTFGFFNLVYLLLMLTTAFALTATATTLTDLFFLYLSDHSDNFFHLKYEVTPDFSEMWRCEVCGFYNMDSDTHCKGVPRFTCPNTTPPCGAPRPPAEGDAPAGGGGALAEAKSTASAAPGGGGEP